MGTCVQSIATYEFGKTYTWIRLWGGVVHQPLGGAVEEARESSAR